MTTTTTTLTPGTYPNVPANEYHRWPAASQSLLKIMRDRSPAHARWQMLNPTEPTPAMQFGTALHMAVLQPELFDQEYVVAPDVDRRTKAGRAVWEDLLETYDADSILKADEMQRIQAMRESIMANPTARALIDGERELSALWNDKDTGVLCKARFDVVNRRAGAIVDLKTTNDASPSKFPRSIYDYGYYIQAAHYLAGALTLGLDVDLFAIVAIEKEPPYAVAVYQIEDQALVAGEDELRQLLSTYARCQETGEWPAYGDQAVRITLPRWAWSEVEERVGGSDDY